MFEFDGILLKPCLLQPCFHVAGCTHARFSHINYVSVQSRARDGTRTIISMNISIMNISNSIYIYI